LSPHRLQNSNSSGAEDDMTNLKIRRANIFPQNEIAAALAAIVLIVAGGSTLAAGVSAGVSGASPSGVSAGVSGPAGSTGDASVGIGPTSGVSASVGVTGPDGATGAAPGATGGAAGSAGSSGPGGAARMVAATKRLCPVILRDPASYDEDLVVLCRHAVRRM
jgi:hypothetical protein